MSLIGSINGIPLFSTVQEALGWAVANGLSGYHSHVLHGQQGYMGGSNHQQAVNPSSVSATTTNTTSSTSTSSGSSGGGGGGGY